MSRPMKTLDKVIELSERCTLPYPGDCLNCEYFEDETGYDCRCKIIADALHYLKVLKDILDPLKAKKITHEITCPQCNSVIAILLPESNDPLTWDELKTMEGKPVWIEMLSHDIWEDPAHRVDSEWWVIGEIRKDDIIAATYLDEMELCEEDLGNVWQAYRKERE